MLVIRQQQMQVLEQDAWRRFEDEMMAHSRAFAPAMAEAIGGQQLRLAVTSAIKRAVSHGFTCRGPIRLYIEFIFLFGSGFDTDPRYPEMARVLCAPDEEMQRANQLYEMCLKYQETVSGEAGMPGILPDLLRFVRQLATTADTGWMPMLMAEMQRLLPRRTACSGDAALQVLLQDAVAESRRHGFSTIGQQALIAALMFAFGHGCTRDPLYPWIERTLKDDKIVEAAARAEQLELQAIRWQERAVGGFAQVARR